MRNIESYFYYGFIRLHILYHAGKAPIYGLEMIEELSHHGYQLSPGTMYPLLHNMEKAGYLKSTTAEHSGRLRKYYISTKRGDAVLADARKKVDELTGEIWPHKR
jgi:DNA-binding PadR family transcriptional regulator